jgi:hypothetical protein
MFLKTCNSHHSGIMERGRGEMGVKAVGVMVYSNQKLCK